MNSLKVINSQYLTYNSMCAIVQLVNSFKLTRGATLSFFVEWRKHVREDQRSYFTYY